MEVSGYLSDECPVRNGRRVNGNKEMVLSHFVWRKPARTRRRKHFREKLPKSVFLCNFPELSSVSHPEGGDTFLSTKSPRNTVVQELNCSAVCENA